LCGRPLAWGELGGGATEVTVTTHAARSVRGWVENSGTLLFEAPHLGWPLPRPPTCQCPVSTRSSSPKRSLARHSDVGAGS
jgi:hypothetical protein